eukprot:2442055-Amphidinium_carterae.1
MTTATDWKKLLRMQRNGLASSKHLLLLVICPSCTSSRRYLKQWFIIDLMVVVPDWVFITMAGLGTDADDSSSGLGRVPEFEHKLAV